MIQTTRLPNGVRIVTETVNDVRKNYLLCTMVSGSQCEPRALNGLAHCVEHCLFLGTQSYDENAIRATERRLGCDFNAETHQEKIEVSAEVLTEDLFDAMAVLADMVQNPTFPDHLIEREKEVITTEIAEVQDDDENYADNMMHIAAFKRDPLGLPIEGSVKTVKQITTDALKAFHKMYFRPENLIVSVAGQVTHESFVQQCADLFGAFRNETPVPDFKPTRYFGGEYYIESNGDLDLFRIGFQGIGYQSYRQNMCGELFAAILEDVLHEELRHKTGLLYCVHANNHAFSNQGMFVVSGTCEPQKTAAVLQRACWCICGTKNNLSAEMLATAKKRIKLDLTANDGALVDRVSSNAFDLQYYGRLISLDESYQILDSIRLDEIKQTARDILQTRLAFSGLGHMKKMPTYQLINQWLRQADEQTTQSCVVNHTAFTQLKKQKEPKQK